MFAPAWRTFLQQFPQKSRPARRRPAGPSLRCEQLEARDQPSAFTFSTGNPDGKIATISEPANAHNSNVEFETGDDFIATTETQLNQATFTGLLTGGATPADISNVAVEIYRVFPKDSNLARTPQVPSRVNSPSDIAFAVRDSAAAGELAFNTAVLNGTFTALNSVSSPAKIALGSGGNGTVTGQEVQFTVTFSTPFDLPPDHYFFVPQVGLSAGAPAGSDFLWLSAPKPIVAPGTPFSPDLQSWMRDDPPLAPDWLRIGQDIIGNNTAPFPTFNAAFSLSGETFTPQITSLSQTAAAEGSPNLALTVNGSNFTAQSTVLFNGVPLTTTFVSAGQLTATIPAGLLADEGSANITVADAQRGLSNAQTFLITENVPSVSATLSQSASLQNVTLNGLVGDQAIEGHSVRVNWGDGTVDVFDLGVGAGGNFTAHHHYKKSGPRHRTITVIALDNEGTASAPLQFSVRVHK
jgi:hypothetical protein